jgi:hypothetical protein
MSMKKLFHSILSANRKRRDVVVTFALWVLRQVRDVEKDEMHRYSDKLDEHVVPEPESVFGREYAEIEDEYSNCEYSLGVLEYAIESLEFNRWRF